MFTIHYIDFWGKSEEDTQLDFVNRKDAEKVFEGIKARFLAGSYGPEVVEVALYDESIEEMLATSAEGAVI
jgi:hypothetical protein